MEWSIISAKIMGKGLHKLFKAVINELNIEFHTLGESVSEVSHFIPEPRNLVEVKRLPADIKNSWLKSTLKDIKHLINNNTFRMDESEKGGPVIPCMDFYKANNPI